MFQVVCAEGFDGGLPQEFIAEVYLMGHKNPIGYVNSKWVFTNKIFSFKKR